MTKVLLDTDKAAVIEAVSGATVTDAGTPASDDKVLIQDTSDSDNLKYVNIADLPGGGVDVLSNVATDSIIGRTTAGSGDSEELTASATRTFLNVEDDADKTDTANVEAAGALMDSEVTNLAQVKAFDSTDYATSAQGTKADSALQARGAVNAQTGTTYTLVIGDEYLLGVSMTNASANTITIPPNSAAAFPVGTKVFITQGGAGSTTIAAGAGVTINAPSTVTLAIDEQWESRVCQKTGTNEWLLI